MDRKYVPTVSLNDITNDSAIIFKVSSTPNKNNSFNLTEMALSLAMNLSGVERQYFYDAGAKDMYDAGEKLMKTYTMPKPQESNHNNNNPLMNLLSKETTTTNSATMATVPMTIKNNVTLSPPHSVSPSSTSSGFISEESEVTGPSITSKLPQQGPFFNIRAPAPNSSFVRHPISLQQSIEYSPPKYGGNTTTNTMANYNISTPTIQQPSRFPPIGTKRSGSPVRTANLPLNIKNVSTPNSMDGQQSNELFGKNTIWSYSTVKPMAATEPKDKVIYGKRDILDLAGNMKDAKWQYRPAQLPIGNTRMFFENRSQYHRLATFEQTDEKFDECLTCNFLFPKF